jgi:arginase
MTMSVTPGWRHSSGESYLRWHDPPMAWAVIGVPIDSVGRSGGTELAPAALRERGIVERLGATDRGDLDVAIRGDVRDPETGVIGIDGVLATTTAVREAVRETIAAGERPLLLGGCCTLVPGALAGLRDAVGAHRVAYVDGHVDVYDGRTSPTGEAADMPLAVAFGFGPRAWVDAAGGPTTAPEDVVVLGARDPEEATDIEELLAGPLAPLTVLGPRDLDRAEVPAAPFWIHLDVDVLDEREMPATDYLMPDGIGWEELAAVMAPLCEASSLAGFSLGCVNPEKDPEGLYVERTCAVLELLRSGT